MKTKNKIKDKDGREIVAGDILKDPRKIFLNGLVENRDGQLGVLSYGYKFTGLQHITPDYLEVMGHQKHKYKPDKNGTCGECKQGSWAHPFNSKTKNKMPIGTILYPNEKFRDTFCGCSYEKALYAVVLGLPDNINLLPRCRRMHLVFGGGDQFIQRTFSLGYFRKRKGTG